MRSGLFHGDDYLLAYLAFKHIVRLRNKSTGIYYVENFTVPVGYTILPVAGYAALVINNGFPAVPVND